MATTNLGMPTIPENSLQPGVAVNSALVTLDAAVAGTVSLTMTDANYTLLPADYQASVLVIGGTLTAGRDVVFPAAFPSMLVTNNTGQTLTLKKTGQTGVALAATESVRVSSGVTDVLADASGGGGAVSSVNGATGAVVLGGESIAEPVTVLTPSSGVVNIDCALGDYFTLAPTANVTSITFSNLPAAGKAQTIMVRFTQDSSARTVAWPASFKWAGGSVGAVSTGSGAIDVIALTSFNQGTTWLATIAKAFA